MSVRAELELSGLLQASLDIPEAGVTAVIGPSGAGKTLLMRSIAGLERASGTVTVHHVDWQNEGDWLPAHRRSVGFVFQEPSLLPHLTVRGNLEFAVRRRSSAGPTIDEVAGQLGLVPLLDREVDRLSGGEGQRVAIGRALLRAPELLLFDEPVSALDEAARVEVLQLIAELKERVRIPVLYVTHDIGEVARIADHVALMESGRIVASGPLQVMLTRLDLPLAVQEHAEAVLPGTAQGYDHDSRLQSISTRAGEILAASDPVPEERSVRLRIKARDVSITLNRQEETSILNILPARVEELAHLDSRVTVCLVAGGARLLSHVSHRSATALDLRPGLDVFVQIKSVAVLG